jgi:group I intron endonuclease
MLKSGIYSIRSFLFPNKFYIGSAVNLQKRWKRHLSDLSKKQHSNRHLQNHYNLYGAADLYFSVIENCDQIFLLSREQYFMDLMNPTFNINPKADSRLNCVLSFATRQKISDSWKKRQPISMQSRLLRKKKS